MSHASLSPSSALWSSLTPCHRTVRETLVYAARLRQPTLTEQQCEAKAEDVLRILGLKACANTLVGNDAVKGISVGAFFFSVLARPDKLTHAHAPGRRKASLVAGQ